MQDKPMTAQPESSDLAERITAGAARILEQTTESSLSISVALNSFLAGLLPWPYSVGSISIREMASSKDSVFGSAVYTRAAGESSDENTPLVAARNVACVLHTAQDLTLEELKRGYARIGAVKSLRSPAVVVGDYPLSDTPLGVIFSVTSANSLEVVADGMMELNRTLPSAGWPDMVVILEKGTLNYALQFEGDKIKGDFLLPNTDRVPIMPMYVHLFARGLGLGSLNRLCYFLFMHLQLFSPGVKLPNDEAVKGIPQLGINLTGYQFSLKGELVPVPDEMRSDKGTGLRNFPFRIESRTGELLSHVQFIPWQEGGAVRIIGKMPLESVLVFFGPIIKHAQIIQQENARISSVLPITRDDFLAALKKFQAQSNMIVKPEQPSWVVSKIEDEGSSSPFMARLFITTTHLRDQTFFDKRDRDTFDKAYETALTALSDARTAEKQIQELLSEHREGVSSGKAARLVGRSIHVDSIDKDLRKHTTDFVISAARSIKNGMQAVAKCLGLDIGFFFKDQNQLQKGIAKAAINHPQLADYLQEARTWAEKLNLLRNRIEHEGWSLPRAAYREEKGKVVFVEPEIEGQPASQFCDHILDRLCCFVEEVTVYGLRTRMDPFISVSEIPLSRRDPVAPERFRLVLSRGGSLLWRLTYHTVRFEQV